MLLTEGEAGDTRCCGPLGGFCIGTKCMAWRWAYLREPLTEKQMRAAGTAIGVAHALQPLLDPQKGYCGLAEKPLGVP